MNEDSIYTKAVHAGDDPESNLGSLAVPVYQSAVFTFPDAEQGAAIHEGEQPGYFYGRMGNPTQAALEKALCELEGGSAAMAFSSGMAAISTTLFTLLKPGDHIVAPKSLYATTLHLLNKMLAPMGVDVTLIDATNAGNYADSTTPKTKVYYLESPSNPTLQLIDIQKVAKLAHDHQITTVMDSTFATPYNQRPLALGVDAVVHSATKYLGGHGDLTAGVVIGSDQLVDEIRWHTNKILGGVIGPNTAWLVLRGLKTLALRMERHNANAMQVAKFLEQNSKVKKVYYPGLESHPQHDLAKQQMQGYGGMIAFDVGGVEQGRSLVDNLKLCSLAVSLGDVATLIQHSASMTHASIPREQRLAAGITDGLIRLSVRIEYSDDIIADLDRGLASV